MDFVEYNFMFHDTAQFQAPTNRYLYFQWTPCCSTIEDKGSKVYPFHFYHCVKSIKTRVVIPMKVKALYLSIPVISLGPSQDNVVMPSQTIEGKALMCIHSISVISFGKSKVLFKFCQLSIHYLFTSMVFRGAINRIHQYTHKYNQIQSPEKRIDLILDGFQQLTNYIQ